MRLKRDKGEDCVVKRGRERAGRKRRKEGREDLLLLTCVRADNMLIKHDNTRLLMHTKP